jgi:hypothetical protein
MEWDEGTYREFYDLTNDPEAWFNLVENSEYSREVVHHKNLLDEHFGK